MISEKATGYGPVLESARNAGVAFSSAPPAHPAMLSTQGNSASAGRYLPSSTLVLETSRKRPELPLSLARSRHTGVPKSAAMCTQTVASAKAR